MPAFHMGFNLTKATHLKVYAKRYVQEFIAKGKSLRNAEMAAWEKARRKIGG